MALFCSFLQLLSPLALFEDANHISEIIIKVSQRLWIYMKINNCSLWKCPPQLKIPESFINETWLCQSAWRNNVFKSTVVLRSKSLQTSHDNIKTQHTVSQATEPPSVTWKEKVYKCWWMRLNEWISPVELLQGTEIVCDPFSKAQWKQNWTFNPCIYRFKGIMWWGIHWFLGLRKRNIFRT